MPEYRTDVSLAPMTTLGIGGPADRLIRIESADDLVELVKAADAKAGDPDANGSREPFFLIAGGSNVVIADEGVRGTTIAVATNGIESRFTDEGLVELVVQAGEPWDGLVAYAIANDLAGIECLSGIPGSTGATPIQNVGAYGQEVSSVISSVRVLDRESGEVREMPAEDCGFGYRTSRFKGNAGFVVLAVNLVLDPSPESEPVAYSQLADALGVEPGARAPLAAVRETVLELRRSKSMVIDPADPNSVSAGSFFTNPVLSVDEMRFLTGRAAEVIGVDDPLPAWPTDDGRVKTSAAWLIERAGYSRGYGEGAVGLSENHTLALVNRGGATAAELVGFAREIADGVQRTFGVSLIPEPVFVGHRW
jgi:UDP-N-acetylmuramate dehydrogenase